MKSTFQHAGCDFTFTDADVVEPDSWIPAGEYNPHNVRPFLIHDHGFALAIVFASHLGEALDIAADEERLGRFQIADEDRGDYPDDEAIAFLGNASEPFDIETLGAVELPNPPFSWCATFNASRENAT